MQGVASQKALADMLNQQTAKVGQQSQARSQMAPGRAAAPGAGRRAPRHRPRGTRRPGGEEIRRSRAPPRRCSRRREPGGADRLAAGRTSRTRWARPGSCGAARCRAAAEPLGDAADEQGRQQIADTESQRGDLTSENLTKLRQQAYENLVTNQGLNIKQQDLQNQLLNIKTDARRRPRTATLRSRRRRPTARAARRSRGDRNRLSDQQFKAKYGLSKRQQAERERHNQALENKPGAGSKPKPATQAAQSTFRRDASSALAVANALKGKRLDRHKAAAALTAPSKQFSKGLDPVTASVALDVAYDGHISQYNVDRLHKAGIAVNQLPWPTRRQFERRRRRSSLVLPRRARAFVPSLRSRSFRCLPPSTGHPAAGPGETGGRAS
jgi:hypothetical protein